jgi:hypothetical protein
MVTTSSSVALARRRLVMLLVRKGNDKIFGNGGNDTVSGGPGDDYIDCGPGADNCDGFGDNDIIIGGQGTDIFTAGNNAGDDVFIVFFGDAGGGRGPPVRWRNRRRDLRRFWE